MSSRSQRNSSIKMPHIVRSGALPGLPTEILELIAAEVGFEYITLAKKGPFASLPAIQQHARINALRDIKNLRLICINFALLTIPKRAIFNKMRFYALPDYVKLLEETRLDGLAPFISTIEFSAYPFGPSITKREFTKRILRSSPTPDNYTAESIDEVYDAFQKLAFDMRYLLEAPRLQDLWVRSLKALPNVRHIELESPIRAESHHSQIRRIGVNYRPNVLLDSLYFGETDNEIDIEPDDYYGEACCLFEDEVARNGNILLGIAVRCLALASVAPSRLEIRSEHTADFHWELIPEWKHLNLTRVVDLRYESLHRSGGSQSPPTSSNRHISSLQALLSRVSDSVRAIELKNSSSQAFTWHNDLHYLGPQLHFSTLRTFSLVDGYIDAYAFTDFISKQNKLEKLRLEDVWPIDYHQGAWKQIFSVLRQRSLVVEIVDAYVSREAKEGSGNTFSVYATANATLTDVSEDTMDFTDEGSSKVFEKDLKAYIEGDLEWTSVLEDRFLRDDEVNTSWIIS